MVQLDRQVELALGGDPGSQPGEAGLEAAVEPNPRGGVERGHRRRLVGARRGRLLHQHGHARLGRKPSVGEVRGGWCREDHGVDATAIDQLRGALVPGQLGRELGAARGLRVRERSKPESLRAAQRRNMAALGHASAANETDPELANHHTSLARG